MTSLRLLLLCILLSIVYGMESDSSQEDTVSRAKRSYYGGYDYDWGGDYWYAGRIFGIIIGIMLLLFCCCVPCICLLGVWFLGWFGIKNRRAAKKEQQSINTMSQQPPPQNLVHLHSEPQPIPRTILRETREPPRTSFSTSGPEHVIYAAEDRYYTSSTSPPDRHNQRI